MAFVNLILVGLLKIVFVRQVFSSSIFHCPCHGRQAYNENAEAQAKRAFQKIKAHLGRACATFCSLGLGQVRLCYISVFIEKSDFL